MVIFWCYLIVSSRKLDGIKQSMAHFNHKKFFYIMIYKTCNFYMVIYEENLSSRNKRKKATTIFGHPLGLFWKFFSIHYLLKNYLNFHFTGPECQDTEVICEQGYFYKKNQTAGKKHNNPAHKKIFNYLERYLKSELYRHKKHILEDKLTYLKEFNQSESKHWQALLSTYMENNKIITILPAIQPKLQNYLHSNIRETRVVYLSNTKLYAYN
ncbi:hypothetical protein BpHYR1_032371 [Brachionus plicatilis]|uniref:Uncharacterized protein n=1 Tax=Brachionus plicatilis TaxID=10195 RepID=A0A3M7SGY0_BRAPC|nr:hypothetical protein BpHYR1_032371 [Brachionus plicatilis]